jgi:quercetin dioxygenase-like cupin family protein
MCLCRKYTNTMILKHASDVPAVPMIKPGFSRMQARFLLTADEGCPRYAMRLMEFAPGGHCSFHNYKEEHEIYFLEGEGILKTEKEGESKIRAGDAVLLMPCELHQIWNTGTGVLKMICTVPLFPGKTGKETTPCM